MIKHTFLLLFLFNLVVFSHATNTQLQQLTTSDGLSNNIVNVVFQDSNGFIWVGTEDGLNRFDGKKFEVFRLQYDGINSIGGNRITSLTEDQDENIWIGLRDAGISLFNWRTGNFTQYKHNKEDVNSIPESSSYSIYAGSRGVVWVITDLHLSKFDAVNRRFINYEIPYEKGERPANILLTEESDSTLLLGSKEGLKRFQIYKQLFSAIEVVSKEKKILDLQVFNLATTRRGYNLLGTNQGLYEWTVSGEFTRLSTLEIAENKRSNFVFAPSNDGNIWIGSESGIHFYDVSTKTIQLYRKLGEGVTTTSLVQDSSGVLWVGTKFNGLFKLSAQYEKFHFFDGTPTSMKGENGFNVLSVFVENDSIVWLGTKNKGYTLFNYKKKEKVSVGSKNINSEGISSIYSFFQSEDGQILMGTNAGLFLSNPKSKKIEPFFKTLDKESEKKLSHTIITSITFDSSNIFWMGTRNGLYRMADNKMESFYQYDEDNELVSDAIHTLCLDDNGNLLIGTASGVCYYDSITSKIRSIKYAANIYSLKNQVTSMACDHNNTLWLGTNLGLLKMDRLSNDSASISVVPGLDNEMITSVLVDKSNRVWVSSSKAISMLMTDGGIRRFEEYDGLPNQMFNFGSVAMSPSGEVFFGSVSGLSWAQPDSIQYNTHLPPVVLVGAKACYKGKRCEELSKGLIESIQIKYQPGLMLEVSLAALDYNQPDRNYFQIYLEGYDETWRAPSTSNVYVFPNLSSGRYLLKVRASNNDFIWNDQILEIPINIRSPLWHSKFAYLFYAFIVFFLIHILINHRVRHYRRANRILTEKNEDKNKLEEQQEILTKFHQNITDSINYALRIQTAMMPSLETMKGWFPKLFVYFRPKDLVSGDFYWMYHHNHNTYVVVADCTGHGVPGAFMSIIGIDLLKSAIVNTGETAPEKILERMSRELEQTLHNNPESSIDDSEVIKDAMDISLCVINSKKKQLHFAGAIHDLYLIRNSEMQVLKGDRAVIGRREKGEFPNFTCQTIHLEKDDMVYLFTDGFVDQFGGPNSKKYMYRRFRHLLLNLHHLEVDVQKKLIHSKFEEWKGFEEQVDDILIMGFKPLH